MRSRKKGVEESQLVHDLHASRVHRVAAEVAQEIRVLLQHDNGMPARASSTPSIIPAGPPPAMQQLVEMGSGLISDYVMSPDPLAIVRGSRRRRCCRVASQATAELRDGLVEMLFAHQREAEQVMRGGIVSASGAPPRAVCDGVAKVVLLKIVQRQVALCEAVVAIDRDRALVGVQCFVIVPERDSALPRLAQASPSRGLSRT
jgi:hypothetical protein